MQKKTTRKLRELLATGKTIVRPACYDPLSALTAQKIGFEFVGIGGFAQGAHSTLTEPLLNLSDMTRFAERITAVIDIPIMVDVGAGFGEAIQVWNTVREMERVGVAGMQIEDQVYPKRAHYHRDYQERTIELDHMLEKITAAVEARRDKDFVICGRTDTMKTEGFKEAVRRGNAFAEAGADIIYIFPNNLEETKQAPKEIKAPLVYGVSHGNRVGRPLPTPEELGEWGYRVISYPTLLILEVFGTIKRVLTDLKNNSGKGVDIAEMVKLRKEIEDTIGLEHLYAIEERTTEKDRKRA